jgi:hypothetical protein
MESFAGPIRKELHELTGREQMLDADRQHLRNPGARNLRLKIYTGTPHLYQT